MKVSKQTSIDSLVVSASDLPFDGLQVEAMASFSELCPEGSLSPEALDELKGSFQSPVSINANLTPVGSKVDLKGRFETEITTTCDRCGCDVKSKLSGDISIFLMPKDQFSDHDKPGGKVIHGHHQKKKDSRHHSKSKSPKLLDTDGEHEDDSFGAFDGRRVDLRPLVRENMILQIPMKSLCSENCKGVCTVCAQDLNKSKCQCPDGPHPIEEEKASKGDSPLAQALKKKIKG